MAYIPANGFPPYSLGVCSRVFGCQRNPLKEHDHVTSHGAIVIVHISLKRCCLMHASYETLEMTLMLMNVEIAAYFCIIYSKPAVLVWNVHFVCGARLVCERACMCARVWLRV
jgi:hypothetical protein